MGTHVQRTYADAIRQLNSAISHVVINKTASPTELHEERCKRIWHFLEPLGITTEHIARLNVVHVTGSKGKGSTCAIVESVLRTLGYHTGFISSPHLVNVEERIRIAGKPISQDQFAQLFWDVYDSVDQVASIKGLNKPSYLQYILLMAYKAFVTEKVDAAIVEVGIGGRYDHTNFITNPCVTAVTSLSLEHTDILGATIEEIAWKKAGIFKPGCPAIIAAGQPDGAMRVFFDEASKVGCPLYVAPRFDELCVDNPQMKTKVLNTLQRDGFPESTRDVRTLNMALGLSIVDVWLQRSRGVQLSPGLQPPLRFDLDPLQIESALCARWPGRWQTVVRKNVTYFLDGAHTDESVQTAAEWFQSANCHALSNYPGSLKRVLLFTVLGSRDPEPMLKALKSIVRPGFDLVLFANPHDGTFVVLPSKQSMDARCLAVWNELCSSESADGTPVPAYRASSVSHFIDWLSQVSSDDLNFLSYYPQFPTARGVANGDSETVVPQLHEPPALCHVLVTGSLYLVGAALKALKEPV